MTLSVSIKLCVNPVRGVAATQRQDCSRNARRERRAGEVREHRRWRGELARSFGGLPASSPPSGDDETSAAVIIGLHRPQRSRDSARAAPDRLVGLDANRPVREDVNVEGAVHAAQVS